MSNRDEVNLVLAAEDFDEADFNRLHRFSKNDERVISKLMAHGPVLLQGSRGSGKSALMRAAAERLRRTEVRSESISACDTCPYCAVMARNIIEFYVR
jgi:predicted AAA+ superfamily ATPase